MPIYVRPCSRREFLLRTALGASAVAAAPLLRAAESRVEPDTFALLSDTHIAADQGLVVRGTNMAENLRQATREILAWPRRPAAVFVCGDCAYNVGRAEDYAALSERLAPLREGRLPMHLIVGNHDHRENFLRLPGVRAERHPPIPNKDVALLRTTHANWFLLDSLEKTNSTPGLLDAEQLAWLARTLDANSKKPAIVMVHHNPGISGNTGLKDTVALFEVIRPRKQVKAYIFGHTHTWRVEQDLTGLHLINLPAVAYTFSSSEPSGWVHAQLSPAGMRLELRCLKPNHPAQGQVLQLDWRKT
jgi:calcineurin-like phosphoesterase family protein